MKFSMCVGGLKYNVSCLTDEFYYTYGKNFECKYCETAYNICVTKENLSAFWEQSEVDEVYDATTSEAIYIFDIVAKHCLDFNRIIVHGVSVAYNGNGYIFMAPSGTGKTTHALLWKKYLGDKVTITNGDKTMLEFSNDIIVHATPFRGKENFGTNLSVPLKAIVIINRSEKNSFTSLSAGDSLYYLLRQCYLMGDKNCGFKVIKYVEKLIPKAPVYLLNCDVSKEAFQTCFDGLKLS